MLILLAGPTGLKISRVSGQETYFTCADSEQAEEPSGPALHKPKSQPGDYVACLYDGKW